MINKAHTQKVHAQSVADVVIRGAGDRPDPAAPRQTLLTESLNAEAITDPHIIAADAGAARSIVLENAETAEMLLPREAIDEVLEITTRLVSVAETQRVIPSLIISSCSAIQAYVDNFGSLRICAGGVEQLQYSGELAFLIAHELAHHMLAHVETDSLVEGVLFNIDESVSTFRNAGLLFVASPVVLGGLVVAGEVDSDGIGSSNFPKVSKKALKVSGIVTGSLFALSLSSFLYSEALSKLVENVTFDRYIGDRRAQETLADFLAVDIIAAAGFDPRDAKRLFNKITNKAVLAADLSSADNELWASSRGFHGASGTHPNLTERMEALDRYIRFHYGGVRGDSALLFGRKCDGAPDPGLEMGVYRAREAVGMLSRAAVLRAEHAAASGEGQRDALCRMARDNIEQAISIAKSYVHAGARSGIRMDAQLAGFFVRAAVLCDDNALFDDMHKAVTAQFVLSDASNDLLTVGDYYFNGLDQPADSEDPLTDLSSYFVGTESGEIGAAAGEAEKNEEQARRGATENLAPKEIMLPLDSAAIIDLPEPAAEVIVLDPDVADAMIRTPRRVYVLGVGAGETTLMFFNEAQESFLEVNVAVGAWLTNERDEVMDALSRAASESRAAPEPAPGEDVQPGDFTVTLLALSPNLSALDKCEAAGGGRLGCVLERLTYLCGFYRCGLPKTSGMTSAALFRFVSQLNTPCPSTVATIR